MNTNLESRASSYRSHALPKIGTGVLAMYTALMPAALGSVACKRDSGNGNGQSSIFQRQPQYYTGRVQGTVAKIYDDKQTNSYRIDITLTNLVNGAQELGLSQGNTITVLLDKSNIPDKKSAEEIQSCKQRGPLGIGTYECELDLDVTGLEGQGPQGQYAGNRFNGMRLLSPSDRALDKARETISGAVETVKEKAPGAIEGAKEGAGTAWDWLKQQAERFKKQ